MKLGFFNKALLMTTAFLLVSAAYFSATPVMFILVVGFFFGLALCEGHLTTKNIVNFSICLGAIVIAGMIRRLIF